MSNAQLQLISGKLLRGEHYRIVFLGDSITSAEWVHPNWREVMEFVIKDRLSTDLKNWRLPAWGLHFINSGCDGATVADMFNSLQELVLAYKPDMLIYVASSNDRHDQIDPGKSRILNESLLNTVQQNAITTVFATTTASYNQEYNTKIESYNAEHRKLASMPGIIFTDLFAQMQSQTNLQGHYTFVSEGNEAEGLKPGDIDYMHPNVSGNLLIAKILLKDVFGLDFDDSLFLADTQKGSMYPGY